MSNDAKTFMVEGAEIIFRNFAGKEGQYNAEGVRNFACVLDPNTAKQMAKDGWNVRELRPQEEGEPGTPYIQIAVNFKNRPPRIVMITSSGRVTLDEASVEVLDYADISNVDFVARGYDWSAQGKTGTKAYLKTMYVTIEEDELERKYGLDDGGSDG